MERKNYVDEFIKSSQRLLNVESDQANNAESILIAYKEISESKGDYNDMCKLSNAFRRFRRSVKNNAIDFNHDSKTIYQVERNFDNYLDDYSFKNGNPGKKNLSLFKKLLRSKIEDFKLSLKLFDAYAGITKKRH